MTTYRLTIKQKREWTPILTEYYNGYVCFFCKHEFDESTEYFKMEYAHLDDKEYHNDIANIALAHQGCNDKMRTDPMYKQMAKLQIEENKNGELHRLLERRKKYLVEKNKIKEIKTPKDNEEITSSKMYFKIAKEYCENQLSVEDKIPYNISVKECMAEANDKVGHCGKKAMAEAFEKLDTKYYGFKITDDRDSTGTRWMQKRPKEALDTE